jgi:hypothetical protein
MKITVKSKINKNKCKNLTHLQVFTGQLRCLDVLTLDQNRLELKEGLGMWCLTSYLTKFQLYCGGQFLNNLYHIILYQVHLV